ncbi:hypothetical protein EV421DRAFT_1742577 [Armillaria borealis]|uniref:Uncharacterized protein n=1 Tax=Armillaria borealis TaxID=47425 RepID=A0AA39IZI9_9AGAR|nr:hypothetical protein EV421DRAFT_1742577 [Armillaria borealis]
MPAAPPPVPAVPLPPPNLPYGPLPENAIVVPEGYNYHVPHPTKRGPYYLIVRGLNIGVYTGWEDAAALVISVTFTSVVFDWTQPWQGMGPLGSLSCLLSHPKSTTATEQFTGRHEGS